MIVILMKEIISKCKKNGKEFLFRLLLQYGAD